MPDRHSISAAAERLRSHVRRTPCLATEHGMLKLEFLQHTGSFKARGAFNRILTASIPAAGVAAASGGNHGAAVAYAARALGHAAAIFVPERTPASKLSRIASYGAAVHRGGADYAEALDACRRHEASSGALDVHAYDDDAVLDGQGTVGLELQEDAPDATHVLIAVGGGGLAGGIASWFGPGTTQIVAVEPMECPTFHAARQAGHPVAVTTQGIAADSLGARQLGDRAFAALSHASAVPVLVDDAAIAATQGWMWDTLRIVAEPGGAVALAPLLSGAWTPPPGAKVAVILCGANTDPASVSRETVRPPAA